MASWKRLRAMQSRATRAAADRLVKEIDDAREEERRQRAAEEVRAAAKGAAEGRERALNATRTTISEWR